MPEPEPFLADQYATLDRQSLTHRFGMWVFLASELLLFSGLFALYAGYRSEFGAQFVHALRVNTLYYGTANTYVLLTSSFTVALAVRAIRRGQTRAALGLVAVTVLLGLAFLAIKAAEYALHIQDGALPGPYYHFRRAATLGGNRFYTMYWVTTGAHAAHVAGGIGALCWVGTRAARGRYGPREHSGFEMAALYWHFVDVMWLFIWPIYYLT
jgi:cytochrome c oxidase subunit III